MSEENRAPVALLGAGTWGLALAGVLAKNGYPVRAWDFHGRVVEELRKTRENPRLPGYRLPDSVLLTADLAEALRGARSVVLVVPSTATRQTCEAARATGLADDVQAWIICSKGIEPGTLMTLDQVVGQTLGEERRDRIAILGGPSHAEEVAGGLPTTIVAAARRPELADEIQRMFFAPKFRVYTNDDILGVELGGALKNVIAIAAGVSDGLGFGDNARAALVTRGLVEMTRLGVAMGAKAATFTGLSGLGDLVVTTGSPHSRNHRFGELLAQGKSCEEALAGVGMVVEGYATALSAHELAKRRGVAMPISEAVYRVLYEGVPAARALEALLARGPKSERE